LNADYGRLLMIMKRPKEALPLLEQGVNDAPKFPDAWSNLALARLFTGDTKGACDAREKLLALNPPSNLQHDAAIVKNGAGCK
jgi:predicted Zn-dependent protease